MEIMLNELYFIPRLHGKSHIIKIMSINDDRTADVYSLTSSTRYRVTSHTLENHCKIPNAAQKILFGSKAQF